MKRQVHARWLGFTFIELLTVIAILILLTALSFSVYGSSKRSALRSVSTQNLRQCFVALTLYAEDKPVLATLPPREVAWKILDSHIIRDPADYWPDTDDMRRYPAMVGSYGYFGANNCHTPEGVPVPCYFCSSADGQLTPCYADESESHRSDPVLMSIFYTDPHLPPGDYRFTTYIDSMMPAEALTLWSDGKVDFAKVKFKSPLGTGFTWGNLIQSLIRERYQLSWN